MHEVSFYRQLFEASPHPYLILRADAGFTIVAVNDKYLEATDTHRQTIVGCCLFDIFPENPNELASESVADLRASLNRVLDKKLPDVMGVQKYDIPLRDGSGQFALKYWSPVNTPVFETDGRVAYIIHHVEDVTEFVVGHERISDDREAQSKLSAVEVRAERMQAEILRRTVEVKEANRSLKSALKELSVANQRLTELDHLKAEFFANVSHELRTPLTLILVPLEDRLRQLQNKDDKSTKERREIELMLRNARLLYRHVTDLLNVAKSEANCMEVNSAGFDIAKLLRTTASYFEQTAHVRNINYKIISPRTLVIENDSEKLQRVLLNLLSNAFKFTPDKGCITLCLTSTQRDVQIDVRDSGPGIPMAMRERVFERFTRVENATAANRNYGGTGLGLVIVKDFVNLLGGKVTLEDSPGGALFRIILSLKAPSRSVLMDQPSSLDAIILHEAVEGVQGNKFPELTVAPVYSNNQELILIVEDDIDMNQFIADTLREHYRVICAYNGQQGLEQALKTIPDVILCDMMMPVMGGHQMILTLRQYPQLIDVPVIMLTARVDEALRLELLKLGVQEYLNKPFVVDELRARINKLITERQRVQEQLRESEVRFQATFEQAAVGIGIVSLEGRWLRVNQKFCDLVGYRYDELTFLTFQEITYAEDLDADLSYEQRMVAGEISTYSLEKRYICKDNSLIWVNLTVSLVRKQDRTPDYFITIIQDIQSRKEIEANLNDAKRIANFGHWRWDLNTNKQIWSEEIFHIYGRDLSLPSANYQEVPQYFTAESWSILAAAVQKCMRDGTSYQCDAEVVKPDGSHHWVVARGEAIRNAEGQIISLHGTVQDITVRKLAEVALKQSKEQLKLFIEYAPASLAMFDCDMRYLAFSQRWCSDYLLGDRNLLGLCHYDVFPNINAAWKAIHRRCLAGEVIRSEEDQYVRVDGTIQWLRWEVRPWLTGNIIGGIVIFTEDITHQKQTEAALQQLNNDLEKRIAERTAELKILNQSLESFVYSVSHDLKAPLRGVEGYSRLLEEDYSNRLDDEGRLFISNIRNGVTRMNELIDDLLAYSRMERCKLESNELDLTILIHQALAEYSEEITMHHIEVIVDLPPLRVYGDREGLALALRNLLGNAIKFSRNSPCPRIEFGACRGKDHVILWIRDNGIGFDMKYNQRIFEIFERLHRLEDYPGTGIGLALVKKAMQRMGGRVWAQSTPGESATFSIEIPAVMEKPEA
ncbi:ATP-binding protein [Nitrosomonas sp.]|uniref:ATP-binding protein n=1 Tax=Nitrosomonas sp. TaxID=42353 RepID=UPI0025DF5D62|nr:ATP-binding protein [Nitrosomonas sp.]